MRNRRKPQSILGENRTVQERQRQMPGNLKHIFARSTAFPIFKPLMKSEKVNALDIFHRYGKPNVATGFISTSTNRMNKRRMPLRTIKVDKQAVLIPCSGFVNITAAHNFDKTLLVTGFT